MLILQKSVNCILQYACLADAGSGTFLLELLRIIFVHAESDLCVVLFVPTFPDFIARPFTGFLFFCYCPSPPAFDIIKAQQGKPLKTVSQVFGQDNRIPCSGAVILFLLQFSVR